MTLQPDAQRAAASVLVVDLDDTLVRTDTLAEQFVALVFRKPLAALMVLPMLLRGRAAFKDRLSQLQPLDPAYVVDQWAQQGADLDPETRQCRPGRVCSHYQQLVAPSAREVGCARLVCPALDQVWICQYRLG